MLAHPGIEALARHIGLHAPVAGGAPVVEGQFGGDHIGDEVGAPHGQAPDGVGLDVVAGLEIVLVSRIAIREIEGTIEDEARIVDEVHDVRRRGAAQHDGGAVGGVHEAMMGVEWDGEKRPLLPFEGLLLRLPLLPHFRGAAPFDHEAHLLVDMALDVQGAACGHLHHIHAPEPLGAEELDIGAPSAQPPPRRHGQVEHGAAADAAIDGDPLRLHEAIIGHGGALELAMARVFARLGLVPMGGDFIMRHETLPCWDLF